MTHSPASDASEVSTAPTRQEIAARVRAAMGFAGLSYDRIAELSGDSVTPINLRRICWGKRDAKPVELAALARVLHVPMSWFEHGLWTRNADLAVVVESASPEIVSFGEGSLENRVSVLERYVADLLNSATRSALPPSPALGAEPPAAQARSARRPTR